MQHTRLIWEPLAEESANADEKSSGVALQDPKVWQDTSNAALKRVEEHYTWKKYAQKLMTLTRVYSFWRLISRMERRAQKRYLEMFYILKLRPLIAGVPVACDDEPDLPNMSELHLK